MTRTPIDLGFQLERLSILDEHGNLDESLDPQVPQEDLRRLYRAMLFMRAYDERRLRLQRQGRIGTFGPIHGQEAAQLGSVYAIESEDWVVPSFRELAVAFWRGMEPENDLLYCAGFDEAVQIDPEAHDLPICIPVASQMPHAMGLAWGLKLQGQDRVVLCYFGDGATSEGDFHEALNLASLHQVPLVFFCQNNQWAISVPRSEQTRSRTLAQKGLAYEIPSIVVDGNDLLAVIVATREAVQRARQGRGPSLIEAVTYRMGVHTTADDPTLYRGEGEVKEWERRDPLKRLKRYLTERGWLSEPEVERWNEQIKERIDDAVARFEKQAARLRPIQMFDHHFAALPTQLAVERADLEKRLKRRPLEKPKPRSEEEKEPTSEEGVGVDGAGKPERREGMAKRRERTGRASRGSSEHRPEPRREESH